MDARQAVCIPVRGDAQGLRQTLAAVRRLDGLRPFVVVAVDGPDAAVEAAAHEAGADHVVVLPSPAGSYAARNAAVAALPPSVELVAFTDAGCVPVPGWLLAHERVLSRVALSGGAVDRVRSSRVRPAEYIDSVRNLDQQKYVEQDGFAATCNLAVRRAVLDELGFDGTLESGGDREFCRRALAAGHELAYAADAVVAHECRRTVGAVLAKARRVGRGVAALPADARPMRLPTPRLHAGLARRAWREGVSRDPFWLVTVALVDFARTRAFVRAATGAGFRGGRPGEEPVDVVVLLGSRWADLERHNTRWRRVVEEWLDDPRVASVTVVDFPRFRRRALVKRDGALARTGPSWLEGVTVVDATVPAADRPDVLDPLAWWRAGRAVRRQLPQPGPTRPRLVVAATPLWAPVLRSLDATWTHFDAVDDWRAYQGQAHRRARIHAGYAAVAADAATTVTAVSPALSDLLREDLGITAAVVPNGVDLDRFREGGRAPGGLPDGPFATYVGVVEARVDLDLLAAVASGAGDGRVVVAGPVADDDRRRLVEAGAVCLGRIAPDEVPGLLQRASLGLLPHRVDALTATMDPLKLLEYLAAGLPVVTTPVQLPGDVDPTAITVAASTKEFVAAVSAFLASPPPRHDGAAVAHRRWSSVADTILTIAVAAAPAPHQELAG